MISQLFAEPSAVSGWSQFPQISGRRVSTILAAAEVGVGDEVAGPDRAALGNNADFAPPPPLMLPPPATVKAWRLRSYGREILTRDGFSPRMRWCGSRIARNVDGVGLYARPTQAYGRVNGVCVCGQSLACPVCAPRIAAFRAAEVAECFTMATAGGYVATLCTFTVPHHKASTLGEEIDAFGVAWRRFGKGKVADKRARKSLGNHVGRECTWGEKNGWHYHHHQLRYDQPGTFCGDRARAQWLNALEAVGRRSSGTESYAFDCGVVGNAAGARYVSKLATSVEAQARSIGSEIASSATKGRNLATLLQAASIGDAVAGRVWLDGVKCITTRKVSSVRWSRGLRAATIGSIEKTDGEVALDESLDSDVFLGALTPLQWRGVLHHRAEFALCCAANQGLEKVNSFLAGLSLGQLNDDAPAAVALPLDGDNVYLRRAVDNF